jgi:hypothetical protein
VWENVPGENGIERATKRGVSSNGYMQTKEELE